MLAFVDPAALTPEERLRELGAVFVAGILCLYVRHSGYVSDAAGRADRLSRPAPASG